MIGASALRRWNTRGPLRRLATAAETRIQEILQRELAPSKLVVKDISGGCGSMFDINVESSLFKGKSLVLQHKLVNEVLKKEIKEMHGLTLKTKAV